MIYVDKQALANIISKNQEYLEKLKEIYKHLQKDPATIKQFIEFIKDYFKKRKGNRH